MLGDNIKLLRKSKGFTQEELAIRLNVVRQTVSNCASFSAITNTKTKVIEVEAEEILTEP